MPAVRTHHAHCFGPKAALSPYDLNYSTRSERTPFVRVHSPPLDISFGHVNSYEAFEDAPFALSPWLSPGALCPELEVYESAPCLPALTSSPDLSDSSLDESLDGNLFHSGWAYDNRANNYDTLTVVTDLSSHPNAYSPTTSLVSCSPRSDHSGLSLSPQPPEHSHALTFNYSTRLPHEFPASSSTMSSPTLPSSHSPKSPLSHFSPTSCSSAHQKKRSKSRDMSPNRPDNDARRRFPCLIIGCERRFTSQYTLKVHMEAHKPKPRVSFPCTLGCNERFSRQHDRLRHEVAKHGKICEFSCDECGRFFSTRKTLGNHKCPVAQGGTRWVTN